MAAYEAASQQLLRSFSPHELAQVVWAFARLPYQPSEAWRGIFLEAVQVRQLGVRELVVLLQVAAAAACTASACTVAGWLLLMVVVELGWL